MSPLDVFFAIVLLKIAAEASTVAFTAILLLGILSAIVNILEARREGR